MSTCSKAKKGEALRRFLEWPQRKLFYKADLWRFLDADPSYYIDDWLKRGFIKRVERGLYTTAGLGENMPASIPSHKLRAFFESLPRLVCRYQLKVAYNELMGQHSWKDSLVTQWVKKGYLEEELPRWYKNKVRKVVTDD